jgi:membrane protein DedA with SNARE-associated domain
MTSSTHVFEPLIEYFQGSPVELLGLLSLLILCGMGLPIPEDIILMATGMIAQETGRSWLLASIVMYAGVLAGDSIAFFLGRRFGMRLLALPWIERLLSSKKQRRIAELFHHYGSTVFFVARVLPGLRAAIFCTAGAMKARYLNFLFFDGAAALISVPFFVWLGYFLWGKFGDDVVLLHQAVSRTHSYTLWVGLVAVAVIVLVVWRVSRRLVRTE